MQISLQNRNHMWKKCEFCKGSGHLKEECKKLLNPADVPIEDTTSLINAIEFSIIKRLGFACL